MSQIDLEREALISQIFTQLVTDLIIDYDRSNRIRRAELQMKKIQSWRIKFHNLAYHEELIPSHLPRKKNSLHLVSKNSIN